MAGSRGIVGHFAAMDDESIAIFHWVWGQRSLLNRTIEQSILHYIDLNRLKVSDFERLKRQYDRRASEARDLLGANMDRCLTCPELPAHD